MSELILEHKRRSALKALLEGHLASVTQDIGAEDKIIETMSALRG